MRKFKWIYNRLKGMSIGEILYRINEKKHKEVYKKRYSEPKSILEINEFNIRNLDIVEERINSVFQEFIVENHEFETKIKVYNTVYDISEKIDWHKGIKGTWPKNKSSFDISFRDRQHIGDVRFTWEINRHLFLPNLAFQYKCLNKEDSYICLKDHFYHWIKNNPFMQGVNWASPMEIAIRSYEWLITYSQIKDRMDRQFKQDMLLAIINSMEYVSNNFSKFSSANNHLILEAAITSIIGYCLEPMYNQSWFEKGYKILKREIPIQVYEDGVNKEQAAHYHTFVLDMMLQYNFFLKKIKKEPIYEDLIFKMTEFIGMLHQSGQVIEFGDSDDAKILQLDGKEKDYYLYVLQLASLYYKELFVPISKLSIEAKFICGSLYTDITKLSMHKYKSFKVYDKGGYAIVSQNKNFFMFDIGELGFKSIAAHGHADALSLVYYYDKKAVLVDPGTYIYNVDKKSRDYFRATVNHNTLTQNELSQSKIAGPFLWSKKAKAKLKDFGETTDLIYIYGEHDGYKPNIHKRAITYIKKQEILIIEDNFKGVGQVNYIFDSNIKLQEISKNILRLYIEGEKLYFYFSKPYEVVEKYISKSFLVKEKTLGIKIKNNFDINPKVYSVISKDPIEFYNNKIIYDNKCYMYTNYKDIRGDSSNENS
ncbi:alginate lyase family protein [Clostridium sporogenes]|uniref:alginate lyase family protein n=1 Tax=Clostridium sporogenes TaxID=1509 RepID=UPI0029008AD7|nr:alginate lyase family protein [Clostridium botulinum]